jgi:hypothetical protein
MTNGTSGVKTTDQLQFKTQTTQPQKAFTPPSPVFQPQQYSAMQRLIADYQANPQSFSPQQRQEIEKLKIQSDWGYSQAVQATYQKSPEALRPEVKQAFEKVKPTAPQEKVETALPENMGLPKPTDMAATGQSRFVTTPSYTSPLPKTPYEISYQQRITGTTPQATLPTQAAALVGANLAAAGQKSYTSPYYPPSIFEVSAQARSAVANVNIEKQTVGGKDVLYITPLDISGKPTQFPTAAPVAGIPSLKGTQGIYVPLPTAKEKTAAFQTAIDKGYADLQKLAEQTPNSILPTKEEFAATVTPDLERQWEANINKYMTSSELRTSATAQLSGKYITEKYNLGIMQSPQYKLQQQAKYLKESGEAEKILKSDIGLQYLVSPVGDFSQLGGTLSRQSSAELKNLQISKASMILATERTFKQSPEMERAGLQMINIGTLGLSQSFLPEEYRLNPLTSTRAYYASQSPAVKFSQMFTMGAIGGELFTLAPAYITGAARGWGITASTPVLTAGKYALTAGQIGKGIQLGAVAVPLGMTAMKGYEMETMTIPKVKAAGGTESEIAGIRTEFWGGLASAAAGGITGTIGARAWLQEEVSQPKIVSSIKQKEMGQLGSTETSLVEKGSVQYFPARTRGQMIAKEPETPIQISVRSGGQGIGQEIEGELYSRTIMAEARTTPTSLKYSKPRVGGGEELVGRNVDLQTSAMGRFSEEASTLETETGARAIQYDYLLGRGSLSGSKAMEQGQILQLPSKTIIGKGGATYSVEPYSIKLAGLQQTSGGTYIPYLSKVTYSKITQLPSSEVSSAIATPKGGTFNFGTAFPEVITKEPTVPITEAAGVSLKASTLQSGSLKAAAELAQFYDKVYGTSGYTPEFGFGGAASAGLKETSVSSAVGALRTPTLTGALSAQQPLKFKESQVSIVSQKLVTPTTRLAISSQQEQRITMPPQTITGTSEALKFGTAMSTALRLETQQVTTPKQELKLGAFTFAGLAVSPTRPTTPFVPLMSANFPSGRDLRGKFGEGRGMRRKRGLPIENRLGVATGILSESLSMKMFGKATLPKGATRKGREIYSSTAELEKAGINVGSFLESGGYVSMKFSRAKKKSRFGKTILGTKFKRML